MKTKKVIEKELTRLGTLSRICLNEACEILIELEYYADDEQQKRINKLFSTVMDGKGYWFPEDYDEQFWKDSLRDVEKSIEQARSSASRAKQMIKKVIFKG
tara:strand:- start:791 stop:1093 length:303 start_codon:yes stop_codon:yes gene_type:complete